jgi:hypothetical protein
MLNLPRQMWSLLVCQSLLDLIIVFRCKVQWVILQLAEPAHDILTRWLRPIPPEQANVEAVKHVKYESRWAFHHLPDNGLEGFEPTLQLTVIDNDRRVGVVANSSSQKSTTGMSLSTPTFLRIT